MNTVDNDKDCVDGFGSTMSSNGSKLHTSAGNNSSGLIYEKEKGDEVLECALQETFQAFDADGSGCIDSTEFRLLLAQLGHDVTEDVARNMIDKIDKDGNGEIDYDECLALFKDIANKEKDNEPVERILYEMFQSHDVDGSGSIDSSELRMLLAQLGKLFVNFHMFLHISFGWLQTNISSLLYRQRLGHDISGDAAREMIAEIDQDGNREMDFAEFLAIFKGRKVDEN